MIRCPSADEAEHDEPERLVRRVDDLRRGSRRGDRIDVGRMLGSSAGRLTASDQSARPRRGSPPRSPPSAPCPRGRSPRAGDDHDLVVRRSRNRRRRRDDVVADDEVGAACSASFRAGALEPVVAGLRREADEDLAVRATARRAARARRSVGSSSIVHGSSDFGRFAVVGLRRPVVGDRGGHDARHRAFGPRERLALDDRLRSVRRRPRRRRAPATARFAATQRHLAPHAAAPRQRARRPSARRAVADEAHRVERLARPAGRADEHAFPRRASLSLGIASSACAAREDLLRLGHPPHAELALGRLALVGADQLDAAARAASPRSPGSPGATTCEGSSRAPRAPARGARAQPR